MRSFLMLIVLLTSVLSGCGKNEVSFSEISIDQATRDVKDFIETGVTTEDSNGIHIFENASDTRYLYLDQDYLESGKGFGSLDIKTDDNAWNIYLTEEDEVTKAAESYRLYKIKLDKDYEYMRVFKNGEETYFQSVSGIKDY
ncbi:hypothetical protein ORD22_06340 [Sporosarcina sp. GW1-11]|uniref:hypothetical protein n=1 Tax=Sporosarcina sp. GW1-11 TaxID=2899126 RepID=UPI00294DB2DD|nr:hypothetical protein [Sporosarcina sp. GW1-11]MDV6377880.1 hypothetical protein [Sporosarcina sp. GW1-11]